ncbi:MAG: riboflavin biosynthesis protein RibF [Bacteroidales bacterium]|nr:riboflavin biosynthesis protein RibF [Bacteroidales bacterium]
MVVTTGFFDGVHIGHRLVIETLVSAARERGTQSVAVTFWPHPRTVLQDGARTLRLLSTLEEKKEMLLSLGVDKVEVLEFTREFSTLDARTYLEKYVRDRFGASTVVLGYDNRFGSGTAGIEDPASAAGILGLEVLRIAPVVRSGVTVSSTGIRRALSDGRVGEAAGMLGYGYTLKGVVVAGRRMGRSMGFPTANMQLYEPLKLLPANGVYKTEVEVLGRRFRGITNIGLRPTVGGSGGLTIETNILGFDEQIYGLDIRLTFIDRIRDEIKFNSLDLLGKQITKDRQSWETI